MRQKNAFFDNGQYKVTPGRYRQDQCKALREPQNPIQRIVLPLELFALQMPTNSARDTMEKKFLTANELLLDSFKLAEQIFQRGFRPHFIVGVWRGGAPMGIAVQEYLDYMGVPTDHIAIRTSSYYGINQQHKEVRVHGLDYVIDNVEADQELLIVDDVFDSGRSIRAVIQEIKQRARRNAPHTMKVACPWFKPSHNVTDIKPDFYVHATDKWLVFPHELKGLELAEILEGKGSEIADTISRAMSYSDESNKDSN